MVKYIRYICPYCNKEIISKKEKPKQCSKCHRKLIKPITVLKEVDI